MERLRRTSGGRDHDGRAASRLRADALDGRPPREGGKAALSLDFGRAETEFRREPESPEGLERYFMRQWALAVIDRSLRRLAAELDPATYGALKPHLAGGPSYGETARKLGVTVTELNNLIHRTRKRYREVLKREVAASVAEPGEVDDEIRDLFRSLKS